MIISDKYKCIFIRIPKNASTSIEKVFGLYDPGSVQPNELPPYGHETASQVRERAGEDKWNTYFKFAFFRNPEERFLSHFTYNLNRTHNKSDWLWWLLPNKELDQRPDKIVDKHNFAQFHVYDKYWSKPKYKYQQVDWLDEEDIFVGSMDRLADDWQHVCDRIGLQVPLPVTNKAKKEGWVLDSDVKELIKTYYKEDIKYYNSL